MPMLLPATGGLAVNSAGLELPAGVSLSKERTNLGRDCSSGRSCYDGPSFLTASYRDIEARPQLAAKDRRSVARCGGAYGGRRPDMNGHAADRR